MNWLSRLITYQQASATIKVLVAMGVVLHLLFFVGVINAQYLWGGKITDPNHVRVMEGISIGVLLVMYALVILQDQAVKSREANKFVSFVLGMMAVFLLINTVGNLFAETVLEMVLGGLVTTTLTVCLARLAKG